MKVYVVTYDSYSSMYVSGVFADKREADQYAAYNEYGQVEEFELDAEKEANLYELFTVEIDAFGNQMPEDFPPVSEVTKSPNCSLADPQGKWFMGRAPDRDTAMKLAAEARQAWLRETQAGVLLK